MPPEHAGLREQKRAGAADFSGPAWRNVPGDSGLDVTARKSPWPELRTRPDALSEKPETSLRHTREKEMNP